MIEISSNTIFIVVISLVVIISIYVIRNLMIKVEKYEDILQDQTKYLQSISDAIREGDRHLKTLDEKGVFQSDDEVGEFFQQMKYVQDELNRYMLPENYGKKEE